MPPVAETLCQQNLVGMDIKLLRKFGQGLFALYGS